MEREREYERDRLRDTGDDLPHGNDLDDQRDDMDGLLRAADRVFDSISNVQAQQYLEQNLQTGGQ